MHRSNPLRGATSGAAEALLTSFNDNCDNRTGPISLLVNLTPRDWERPVNHEIPGETVLSEEIDDHLTWDETIIDRLTAAA